MGLAESAAILLGIGIISSRFGAGVGLAELGTGVQTLVAAPLMGTGTGLLSFATGLRAVFETFGDLGRGLSTLFGAIPAGPPGAGGGAFPSPPGIVPPDFPGILPGPDPLPPGFPGGGGGVRNLTLSGGGDFSQLLPGGGGNVPITRSTTSRIPPYPPRADYRDRNVSMVDERSRGVQM